MSGQASGAIAGVSRISVPKASDILAARLRELILAGQHLVGHSLPSERDLMSQAGLSRASVREALRILELEGLVEIRTGRNGGAYVCKPGSGPLTRSLDLMIRGQGVRFKDLLAAREAIEPMAARQAAVNRGEDDLKRLAELTRRQSEVGDDVPAFLKCNVDWHLAVVEASHNPLFSAFMASISQAVHTATDIEDFNSGQIRRIVIHAHRRVFEAIRDGDATAAQRRMERHVAAYAARLAQVDPERLERAGGGTGI